MTREEIFELIARFERSSLQTLKLSDQDFSIEMEKAAPVSAVLQTAAAAAAAPAAASAPTEPELPAVTAPMVGTFYTAPAPDQPDFVAVGDRVKEGQTVCLMEAMKMMSEVPAPCDCIIEQIVKENGQLAEFGEPLLRYRPC